MLHALTSGLSRSGIPRRSTAGATRKPTALPGGAARAAVRYEACCWTDYAPGRVISSTSRCSTARCKPWTAVQDGGTASGGGAECATPRLERRAARYAIGSDAGRYIRICLLAKRQWHGMLTWMGRPGVHRSSFDSLPGCAWAHRPGNRHRPVLPPTGRTELRPRASGTACPPLAVLTLPGRCTPNRSPNAACSARWTSGQDVAALSPIGIVEIDGRRPALTAPAVAVTTTWCTDSGARPRRDEGLPLEGCPRCWISG